MAERLQKVLDPTNPAGLDRERVSNPFLANAIQDIGKTVVDMKVTSSVNEAKRGLEAERDAVISELNAGGTQDETLTTVNGDGSIRSLDIGAVSRNRGNEIIDVSESAPVKEFTDQMRRLETATTQGRLSPEEAKIRLEAKLRSYLARYPGLTPELQAVGQEVFGMNVLGSELDAALAVQQERTKSAQMRLKEYLDDAKSIGMNIAREHNEEFWQDYFKTKQVNEDYDRRAKEYQLNQWRYTENEQAQKRNINEQMPGELLNVTKSALLRIGDLSSMNDVQYSEFVRKNGERLRQQIGALKEATIAKYQRSHSDLSGDAVRSSLSPVLSAYDRYIGALSADGKLSDIKTANDLIAENARGQLYQRPGYALVMKTLEDVGKAGTAASFLGQNFMRQFGDRATGVIADAFAGVDTTFTSRAPAPPIVERILSSENPAVMGEEVGKFLDNRLTDMASLPKDKSTEVAKMVGASFLAFADRANLDQLSGAPPELTRTLEATMARPDFARVLEAMPEKDAERLREAFGNNVYATRRVANLVDKTVATLVKGFADKDLQLPHGSRTPSTPFFGGGTSANINPSEFLEPVTLDNMGRLVFKAKTGEALTTGIEDPSKVNMPMVERETRRYAVNMQRTAGAEWWNLVRLTAHMNGTTDYKQTAEQLYELAQSRLNGKGIKAEPVTKEGM